MGRVLAEITMSVDGYVAGPDVSHEHPLGVGGERLHEWIGRGEKSPTELEQEIAGRLFATAGAFVLGRRTFDVGIGLWGEDGAFGRPSFVVTNRAKDELVKGPTTFTFVLDGVERAVEQAVAVAGERDVVVMGGADVVEQCLRAGLVDMLRLHVVPVLLGSGSRLFAHSFEEPVELDTVEVLTSPLAGHFTFGVGSGR